MQFRSLKPPKTVYLTLFLLLAACDGMESGDTADQPIAQRHTSALAQGMGGSTGAGGAGSESLDSLTTYTARCEAATGIHVPTFDCTKGKEIPQGTSSDPLFGETGEGIPSAISGSRVTRPPNAVPPNPPTTLVQTISGGGRDIGFGGSGGTVDEFFFVHQDHSANSHIEPASGTVEVQVNSLTNPDPGAKAGIMLRQTNVPNAPFFMVGITAAKTVFFQSRTVLGGAAVTRATIANINFGVWLRLLWDGVPAPAVAQNRVLAQYSVNHVDWINVYDQTFAEVPAGGGSPYPFPYAGLVGLAVTAHKVAPATATAMFDKFATTKTCDRPNVLGGFCDPRSRFQVLAQTADAIVVGNCRKEGSIDNDIYKDIAVIQYNRQNGAICYYQAPAEFNHASAVTTPSLGRTGTGIFPWITPAATHAIGCTSCHDNGPFVRSPYLYQLTEFPKDWVYSNKGNKLRYVGRDFQDDRSWWIDSKKVGDLTPDGTPYLIAPGDSRGQCNSCHTLSVNKVAGIAKGSALWFAGLATAATQLSKNDHSSASPIWMRPDEAFPPPVDPADPYKQYLYWSPAEQSAGLFTTCATNFVGTYGYDPNHPDIKATNCYYKPNGVPYVPMLTSTTDASIGGLTGSATGTLEFPVLTAGANSDITGTTDKAYWTYSYVPGDGTAYVKVTALTARDPNAKAGLTVRDGPNPDAINAMIGITANSTGKSAFFQYRLTTTGTTVAGGTLNLNAKSFPFWLRLDRTGQTFVGSVSTDGGDTWTQVGAATVNNLSTPDYGLIASSKHATLTTQANFESFEWSSAVGWTQPSDAHILVDAKIGANVTGTRKEQIVTETITSSGGDIAGNSDQFMYSFKGMIGEGTVITKVLSQTTTSGPLDPFAKAGLMIREDASAAAANVFLGKTPSGATIQQRKLPAPGTTVTNVSQPVVPTWFRLIRTNNTFIGAMSSNGSNWTQVGDPVVFTNFTWSALVGLAVSSHGAGITQAIFDNGLAGSAEPPGFQWFPGQQTTWLDAAIGMTGGSHVPQTMPIAAEVITASGADIYAYSDQFFYAWQNVTGNATVVAKVESLTPVSGVINGYAKAGIMFRDSATGGAPNAFIAITATQGGTFQNRIDPGANTGTPAFVTTVPGHPVSAPFWVMVTRSGAAKNVFSGFISYDNVTWAPVGVPTTINNIAQTALVGLAVTSHDATKSVTAKVSNFLVTPQP